MSAGRSGYSANYVLIRLIEKWRHALDNNLFFDFNEFTGFNGFIKSV